MELLPIVYISLAAFSVISVAVIIVSYISFKVRQKYGDDNNSEIVVEFKPNTVSPTKEALAKKRLSKKRKEALRRKPKIRLDRKVSSSQSKSPNRTTMNRIEILNPIKITKVDLPKKTKLNFANKYELLKHYGNEDDDNFYTIKGTKSE